jgi:hypothetical protein
LTFGEDEMRIHADGRAAEREEAQRKKSTRRPAPHNQTGGGWQTPQR